MASVDTDEMSDSQFTLHMLEHKESIAASLTDDRRMELREMLLSTREGDFPKLQFPPRI